MATDPATLLSQAACYACYGAGDAAKLLELALVAQWVANAEGNSSNNLVPGGSTYSVGGIFTLTNGIVPGGQYIWTPHANDSSINNSSQNCTSQCQIQAIFSNLQLVGTANATVTAMVVRLS